VLGVALLTMLILDITKTMPSYEYSCWACGGTREIEASMNEPHITPVCCDISMARVWSATSAIFKGNGFYKTDNR
jgi:putative FmdB family regulatory protein